VATPVQCTHCVSHGLNNTALFGDVQATAGAVVMVVDPGVVSLSVTPQQRMQVIARVVDQFGQTVSG